MITTLQDLCFELNLDPSQFKNIDKAIAQFPLRVSRSYVSRMEKGNPSDPLLLQVLPQAKEMENLPGYSLDPLEELKLNPVPGLLHRYHGRVLLTLVGSCAVNCRYCFRRHFPYQKIVPGLKGWKPALDYIQQNDSIEEVILSGGDPLVLKDKHLKELVLQLAEISHLQRLRIHTRLPIINPERINDELLEWLTLTRLKPVIVIHCNHANEIDQTIETAFTKVRTQKILLLNQSVLLKNVNDDANELIRLSKALFNIGVMPYYLNLLDKVHGSAHFEVSEDKAKKLILQMMHQLPGYLVPKLVREMPGMPCKVPVGL